MAFNVSGSFTEDQIKRLNAISNDAENATRQKNQVLDKDAFLKLMMVQLQNQNPLNPTDNTEYMNQMAQFSSVEQLSNIAASSETTNQLSALMSKQMEDMAAAIEKLSGTSEGSEDMVNSQKEIIEQNTKILNELVKMNALLSSYVGADSTEPVTDEEVYSLLGH
ncbi:flagellar hook capping FlgD N-terminal domain-containing protein [Fusibacter bizertensis]|uniref:Flagellar hook capping FlgD N-terminal domain-containing protein n=1 Tax=Fusibacter bizertensis TaxID=1488331 RepID=A0ABT6N885_9FIRM|nr:flagellar hook capping FlgD N-terminal domain-containing protein [Fusibacter bizertensis]MDH8676628.1 flagellar hook capping FlgD N-terminal domain-containing protein [Fusibacter bizertensis]